MTTDTGTPTPRSPSVIAYDLRADLCLCHEGYKSRGMTDPTCESCSTHDERYEAADAIDNLMRELAAMTAERDVLRAELVTATDERNSLRARMEFAHETLKTLSEGYNKVLTERDAALEACRVKDSALRAARLYLPIMPVTEHCQQHCDKIEKALALQPNADALKAREA